MLLKAFVAVLLLCALGSQAVYASGLWPLWESYTARFLDGTGRIVDHDADNRTTSEGQAYGLFFALVANDQAKFERLLSWTQSNLAGGKLDSKLPAWLWGSKYGRWGVLDANSASDADLWLAYTLLEAGRLWNNQKFRKLGQSLAMQIADAEVKTIPDLGPMLLPGRSGFQNSYNSVELNASYLPVQLLLGVAKHVGADPWQDVATRVPRVLRGSAPQGFALDWISFHPGEGFSIDAVNGNRSLGSYDAIRVYLWAGMLPEGLPHRDEILRSLSGMATYLESNRIPPAGVSSAGQVKDARGSVGFSAAVIPFLSAIRATDALSKQKQRLEAERNMQTGLYGEKPRYYDQNLALFATGWSERRFRFDERGWLQVSWK